MTLRDSETDRALPVHLEGDGLSTARRALAQLEKQLSTYCHSRGIQFLTAPCESNWSHILLRLYGVSAAA